MTRKRPPDLFEPWRAEARKTEIGEPYTDGLTPEQASRAIDANMRSKENAGWVIWGSRMGQPGDCVSLLGEPAHFNSEHVVVFVTNPVTPDGCGTKAKHIAERIAACVNSCRSVSDPVETLDGVRNLLRDLANGTSDAGDSRIVSLLNRMIPADQVMAFKGEDLL